MKLSGKLFRLYVFDDSLDDYRLVLAMRSQVMTISSESVDTTSKEDTWRELLEGGGITSMSIKGGAIASDAASYALIKNMANTGIIEQCRVVSIDNVVFSGGFKISSFETSGDYSKDHIFNLTIESALGTVTMRSDGVLILEDGFAILLESDDNILIEV